MISFRGNLITLGRAIVAGAVADAWPFGGVGRFRVSGRAGSDLNRGYANNASAGRALCIADGTKRVNFAMAGEHRVMRAAMALATTGESREQSREQR